jgi:hypothetical protein
MAAAITVVWLLMIWIAELKTRSMPVLRPGQTKGGE